MRALGVEDEPSFQGVFKEMFERLGAEVVVAADAEAGWLAASVQRFDVALVDIGLPGENGISLGARLRGKLRCRQVLLTSGYPVWWLHARGLTARYTLTKPFTLDDLAAALGVAAPGPRREAPAGEPLVPRHA
jgi:DNA-binding response OmpR family regulator